MIIYYDMEDPSEEMKPRQEVEVVPPQVENRNEWVGIAQAEIYLDVQQGIPWELKKCEMISD